MPEFSPGLEIYINCDEPSCSAEERVFDDSLPQGWTRREGQPDQTFCSQHRKTALRECPRMTEDQIIEMVTLLIQERLVVGSALPEHMLTLVFPIIAVGGLAELDPTTVGNVVENIDKAGPRAVNGYPMFFSCRVIHVEDWHTIVERYTRAKAALDGALSSD